MEGHEGGGNLSVEERNTGAERVYNAEKDHKNEREIKEGGGIVQLVAGLVSLDSSLPISPPPPSVTGSGGWSDYYCCPVV